MAYDLYPAVDENYDFPPEVRRALAVSMELRNTVIPMTTALRNNLMAGELWDGRVIANTTTDRLERYDMETALWVPIMELSDVSSYSDSTRIGRNRIINGDFSVNQRNFSSLVSNASFGFDRWKLYRNDGTVTYSSRTPSLGELPESARSHARIVTAGQTLTNGYTHLMTPLESVRTLSGKTVTVSFWAKTAGGNLSVAVELTRFFGTGGSPTPLVNQLLGKVTLSPSWKRYSVTGQLASLSGLVVGTDGNDYLQVTLWTSAGSSFDVRTGALGLQNGTIDIWGVQLEEGSAASLFEFRSPAEMLQMCMRYFERQSLPLNLGIIPMVVPAGANSNAAGRINWLVPKRTTPTVSFSQNGGARYVSTVTSVGSQTIVSSLVDAKGTSIITTATFATSAGWVDNFTIDADAEL